MKHKKPTKPTTKQRKMFQEALALHQSGQLDLAETKYKKKIDGWEVKLNEKKIYFLEKKFKFKNFLNSQKFINEVSKISENEGHHPDILFGWGYAKIKITTHAIEGLSENDFILAAKIDQIINV